MTPAELMRQKLLEKYAQAQDTGEIEAAQDAAATTGLIGGIGEALSTAASANTVSRGGKAGDPTMFRSLGDMAKARIKQAVEARDGKMAQALGEIDLQDKAISQGLDREKLEADRTRKEADDAYQRERDKANDVFKQKELDARLQQIAADKARAAARLEESREAREQRGFLQQENANLKAEDRLNKGTAALGSDLAPLQSIQSSLRGVESLVGPLDTLSNENGKLVQVDPTTGAKKTVDLPGVSLPLVGRTSLFQDDAQTLESTIAKVFNVELRDRSGAAVTAPELDRLKAEFAAGKFNTEAQMIDALKRYKAAALQAMKNAEARYAPEMVGAYRERGGQTFSDFATPAEDPAAQRRKRIEELRRKQRGE